MRKKPNITIPEQFALYGEKTDFTNELINNGFDKIKPEILAGDNLNKFIDDTYKGLNGVLSLYEGIVLHEMTTIYDNTSVIGKFIDEEFKLYKSLQNNNVGHDVTDTEYWEEIKLGGGINEDNLFEIPVVIERYVGENSWYDLYSDGLCIQGGKFTYVSNGTITLLQTYRDVNYYVQLTDVDEMDTGGVAASTAVASLTENTITLSTTSEANYIYWTTRGYVA